MVLWWKRPFRLGQCLFGLVAHAPVFGADSGAEAGLQCAKSGEPRVRTQRSEIREAFLRRKDQAGVEIGEGLRHGLTSQAALSGLGVV